MKTEYLLSSLIILIGAYLAYSSTQNQTIIMDYERPESRIITFEKVNNKIRNIPEAIDLNNFQTEKDINNWFIRYGEIKLTCSPDYPALGDSSMKIEFKKEGSGEIVLLYFPNYWNYFSHLSFDIFNQGSGVLSVRFIIGDYFDNHSWYPDEKKFAKDLSLKPGLNHFRFSIAEISKDIDIESPKKSIHFNFKNTGKGALYITNLQLSRN